MLHHKYGKHSVFNIMYKNLSLGDHKHGIVVLLGRGEISTNIYKVHDARRGYLDTMYREMIREVKDVKSQFTPSSE